MVGPANQDRMTDLTKCRIKSTGARGKKPVLSEADLALLLKCLSDLALSSGYHFMTGVFARGNFACTHLNAGAQAHTHIASEV